MEFRETLDDDAIDVKVAELLVATADSADYLIDGSVKEVLRLLRERMKMDVVFVSEFTDGKRVFRAVDQDAGREVLPVGHSDPLEETWCQRVVDGRMPRMIRDARPLQASGEVPAVPFPVGTYLSEPIVLASGEVYGTLCCFSFGESPGVTEQDGKRLRYTAQLTAGKIERSREVQQQLELAPLEKAGFRRAV